MKAVRSLLIFLLLVSAATSGAQVCSSVGIADLVLLPSREVELTVAGAGGVIELQFSPNLEEWKAIRSFTKGQGTHRLRVPGVEGGEGFFRARLIGQFLEFVEVGHAGAAGDPSDGDDEFPGVQNLGFVGKVFNMGKYEVTNLQYAEFLNAIAKSDPHAVYHDGMSEDELGGIEREGLSGDYVYRVKLGMGDKPVNYVSFWDACRFCNWLHNGKLRGEQGSATTENGSYDLTNSVNARTSTSIRKEGAKYFIPNEDEWYKAAYHQPMAAGGDFDNYWTYPTQSNDTPWMATADWCGSINNDGSNLANYSKGAKWNDQFGNVTTVGSGGVGSASYYRAYDMGGNVCEWIENHDIRLTLFEDNPYLPTEGTITIGAPDFELNDPGLVPILLTVRRGVRGGSWCDPEHELRSSTRGNEVPETESNALGFRVAQALMP